MRFRIGYALLCCSAICCVAQLIAHLHLAWLCTILPIISCSRFARSKYLQMAVNMDGPRCTQGGMLVLSAQPSGPFFLDFLLFFAFCLVLQDSLGNVDDSSGGVPLGIAFLPPLPTPGFVFF